MIVLTRSFQHLGRLADLVLRTGDAEPRRRLFVATHLGLFVGALAAGVVALAFGHVPGLWQAAAAAWLTVPLAAAAAAARSRDLAGPERACLVAWAGFAITTTLCGGVSVGAGCLLVLLLPLLAMHAEARATAPWAGLAAAGGIALLCTAARLGLVRGALGLGAPLDVALLGLALAYLVLLAAAAEALRRRTQARQAVGERRADTLAAATGDLTLHYDRITGIVAASREAEALFGVPPRSLLGRGFFERVHVGDRPAFLKALSDAADSGANVCVRLRFRTGEPIEGRADAPTFAWIEMRARGCDPVPAEAGLPDDGAPVIALVRDITAQVEHERAMEHARDEAERANAWKDSFLANVSHELRTPLNAIIGFSEMLASEQFSPRDPVKQRDYATIITTSGQHLLSVVNSLLDVSRIQAGRFVIEPESFALAGLVDSCCAMVGLKADQAGVTVHRRLAPSVGEIVGDQRACKQIVINLLSNALKFTPRGGEVIVGVQPQGNSVLIAVSDTGVGIAPRDLGRLGDAFFQAQSGYDKSYEGTGLGLSVVRGLVGLHGGGISVESALGEGTRVTVRLPLDCRTAARTTASAPIEIISRYSRPAAHATHDQPKVKQRA